MWFYQRVDLLHLDFVHILKWTVQLCKLSEYLYTDILMIGYQNHHRIRTLNGAQDMDISALVDIRRITGQITGQAAGDSEQN